MSPIPASRPKGTGVATVDDTMGAARTVYKGYPEILKALGL